MYNPDKNVNSLTPPTPQKNPKKPQTKTKKNQNLSIFVIYFLS